jgi:hypothetical protein
MAISPDRVGEVHETGAVAGRTFRSEISLRRPEEHCGGGSLAIGDWPVKIARNCDYRFPIGSHEL